MRTGLCAFIFAPGEFLRAYFCYEVIHLKELLENAKENLSFLLICILIALALVAVARIAEHFLPHKRKVSPTRRITLIAICGAIAMVLHLLDFPCLSWPPVFISWTSPSCLCCCAPFT